jgi:hypothetical protein
MPRGCHEAPVKGGMGKIFTAFNQGRLTREGLDRMLYFARLWQYENN